ncbi:NACHT C-terminal alpha/beta 1 domain-containing protein [Microcoleus sp. D2_18a_B4]|uniref:NACHT C-terminal alpha/beta 1 domain-containing protein n=1 Tax=Microcoleus sp. D2_18a_B4 TaxID=3055329 RepID=UPI002FD5754E
MESWQRWEDFLKIMSHDNQLTDAETESFLLQFARQNLGQSLKEISEQLPLMEDRLGNHKKRMSEVYRKFSKSCVELKSITHKSPPLQKWLETEYSQWLSVQDSDSALSSATTETPIYWRNICLAMLKAEKQLTTNALMCDKEEHFELEEIHVPLALVERKKPDMRGEEILPEQGSRVYKPEYEEKQPFEHEQFLLDILKDGKGKHNGKRIAIIGEPGAGKTTLLRKIAFWVQENTEILPISISLADLPETNSQQQFLEQYLLDKWLPAALPYFSPEIVEVTEALKTELKKLCNQGRVWLLLDGVDEMAVQGEGPLGAISNQLKGWVGQARVVLTCRLNVWEANRNVLADNFEIYRTLDFSYGDSTKPDRVGEFIAKWFNKTPNLGQELRQELDKPGKERITDLVKNPLRLALLCSTWNWWRDRGGLPDTKAKLYQGFIEKFYDWKGKEPTNYTQREKLNRALGELAKLAIDQTESRFRLKHSLVCQVLGQPDEELFGLALKLGWLNKVGLAAESPDETVYAFWHPTFEEYFAALAIDDRDYFLPREHKDRPVQYKDNPKRYKPYRIFESQWKEVILLWLGRGEKRLREQKEEFINDLVNFEDGCGEWGHQDKVDKGCYEYRAYFLVAAAIAEFYDYSQIDEIIGQIVKWRLGYFDTQKQKGVKFFNVISNAAMEALQQTHRPKAIAALVERLNSHDLRDDIRGEVAASLGKIGQGNQTAIDALVQQLNSPTLDHLTLWEVTLSLDKIATGNQKAIAAFEQLLKLNLDGSARCLVPATLGYIDPGNQKAIAALEQLLDSSILDDSRTQVAVILKEIDPGNQKAIPALEELITSGALNDDTRREVAASLGKIDPGNQKAIDTLVQQLITSAFDEEYDSTSGKVAVMLEEISQGNQKVIDALVELLTSGDLNNYTRREVTASLGKIDPGNQKTIDALEELLTSGAVNDDDTRREVAASLGKIDPGNQKAIDALEQLLTSSNYIRREVAESLGKIDPGNQKAIDALEQLLTSSNYIRREVAESLGKIDPGNQKAIDALVQLLNSLHRNDLTFLRVIQNLGNIGQDNQTAIDALVQLLSSPNLARGTRWQVAETLEKMKIDTDKQCAVITALKANVNDSQQIDERGYKLIWHYAQNLPYPDFYQAWHQDTLTNTATANLNIANLPQVLAEAINNQPELCSKVKLICIDIHQFIDPDNPAQEIYDEILNQNYPEWPNGYPDTMQKLKIYWNYLRRQSEIPLFFICYDSTALSATPTGFSDSFLKALSKFDRAICVVCEQENIPLPTFSPSQPDLVAAVVAWMRRSIL